MTETSPPLDQADNRVLDPDDCQREPFAGVNAAITAHIAKEKSESGEQLSYVYPSKVWEYPWAITRHPFPKGEIVLDAGCGVSALPIHLALGGATVVAIDNDHRWLGMEARAVRFHRVPVVPVLMEMESLAFPDESFDRVYCISVLEHLPVENQAQAMREMARVLRPGGILYLTVDYDERERRSEDDVVYDRLAMQRYGIAPSGLEIEGTTDWTRPDWDQHHHRMREFKYHTFAAMAVALRKPPASGPESASAIEARRARVGEAPFTVALDLGRASVEDADALAALSVQASALGFSRAHVRCASRAGRFSAEALGRSLRAMGDAGIRASLSLLCAEADEKLSAEMKSEASREALAETLVSSLEGSFEPERVAWLDVMTSADELVANRTLTHRDAHAFVRTMAARAHRAWPEVPVTSITRAAEGAALVGGFADGAGLDLYAARVGQVDRESLETSQQDPERGPLPAAGWLSLVRQSVGTGLEVDVRQVASGALGELVAALELARERGYREIVLGPETSGALLDLGARDPSALTPLRGLIAGDERGA